MGCRTLLFINHDALARIEKHPTEFVEALLRKLRDRSPNGDRLVNFSGFVGAAELAQEGSLDGPQQGSVR
jgi:hypothetical protein